MKKYDINVKQFQRKREDLVKAQTLFNLPIQTYPEHQGGIRVCFYWERPCAGFLRQHPKP